MLVEELRERAALEARIARVKASQRFSLNFATPFRTALLQTPLEAI